MQKSAQDTQIPCANTKCTQERQDKHIEVCNSYSTVVGIYGSRPNEPEGKVGLRLP